MTYIANRLIVLREGVTWEDKKVKTIIKHLNKIPDSVLWLFILSGVKIIVFNGKLTNNKELKHYKGVRPRGWKKKHKWDKVDGMYEPSLRYVFIGNKGKYYTKKDRDIFLHELGHAFDHIVGRYLHKQPISYIGNELKKARKKQPFKSKYFNKYSEEYIANSFDLYFTSKKTYNKLRRKHTRGWKVINDNVNRLENPNNI